MRRTYFIADLHLSESTPHITALFFDFLARGVKQADALYILGDLFDFWIGDDDNSPLTQQVKQHLKTLSDRGVAIFYQHGNRDFLLGKKFAQACGMQLIEEYKIINLYGTPTLLCHGDTLCIDDEKYQKFRQRVQQKWLQKLFLLLPLTTREKIAHKIRNQSKQDKQEKSASIMDVNHSFVRTIMLRYGVRRLIHGHTHRQDIHSIKSEVEGQQFTATRIVLGDWGEKNSILEINSEQQIIQGNDNTLINK